MGKWTKRNTHFILILPTEQHERLKAMAERKGTSLKELVLAQFNVWLLEDSGNYDQLSNRIEEIPGNKGLVLVETPGMASINVNSVIPVLRHESMKPWELRLLEQINRFNKGNS